MPTPGRLRRSVVWPGAAKIKFGSFTELNAWLADRCRALWQEVRHPEHEQFSVAEMLEHERAHLMPMPVAFDGYVEKPARVSSTCLVSVARNRYSVPCELHGQMVSTRLYPASVVVVADDRIVARHDRLSNAGETRYVATKGPLRSPLAALHPAAAEEARCQGPQGPFVAQAMARRSPTCPSHCSGCAEGCCATRAGTG